MATGEIVIKINMKPWAVKVLKPIWIIQVLVNCESLYLPDWAFTIGKPEFKSNGDA